MSTIPALLRRVGTGALRPLTLIEVFFRRSDAAGDIFPSDARTGGQPGRNSRHVVVLGEPGMISLGVLSHDLGIAGHLARELSRLENRGVRWTLHEVASSHLRDAQNVVESAADDLEDADVAVLMIGISDTLAFTATAAWEQQLHAVLTSLAARLPEDSVIGVGAIPPLDNAGSISRLARIAAGMRARLLNDYTRKVVSGHPTASVIGFPEELTRTLWIPRSEEQQYRNTYTVWGRSLAREIAARLHPHA